MYETLLPKRARSAYLLSRWSKHLDSKTGTLLAHGYTSRGAGDHLRAWVDFVQQYEVDGVELPTDVRSPKVVAYLDEHWPLGKPRRSRVQCSLRILLHDDDVARRVPPMRKPTSALFDKYVSDYLEFARQHRGRREMRRDEWSLRSFFAWLEERGVCSLAAINAADLREYVGSLDGFKRTTIVMQVSDLRGFFRYLDMQGVISNGLAMTIEAPRLYRMSTPPEVLDTATIERLIGSVDRTTALGKRDYAMLLLGTRYGLRPCDIKSLRFDDVRWRQQRIVLVQSKTQRQLDLPLVSEVDEALVDYLRNGRPTCDAREIFVRHIAPITPLCRQNRLWGVMQRAFKTAAIERPAGRRGFHLLRHSAATRMLCDGVPFDTISAVLGHSSVESTRVYAQVDLVGLRSVALSAREVCR